MRIPCCFYPYPGEMLSSTCGRILKHTSLPLSSIDRLCGSKLKRSHNGAFSLELLRFFHGMLEHRLSVMELACSCTIFPMFMMFASERTVAQHQFLAGGAKTSPGSVTNKSFMSIHFCRQLLKSHLCFCRDCFREQLERYGENYWKLIWQLALVNTCDIHDCPLVKTSLWQVQQCRLPTPEDINEASCQELTVDRHSHVLTRTAAMLLANRKLTRREKWIEKLQKVAATDGVTDIRVAPVESDYHIASKMLVNRIRSYWGRDWLETHCRGMVDRHCFRLGGDWLHYLLAFQALNQDLGCTPD